MVAISAKQRGTTALNIHLAKLKASTLSHYKKHGRHSLPWRKTTDPYKILVSEVMLQQTQVKRVLPFYAEFTKRFPNTKSLAKAPLENVLSVWSGLGYNRRAKMLHETAKKIQGDTSTSGIRGVAFPKSYEALRALPGVGDYTAKAVRVFGYNEWEVMIETNIRAVFLHHLFPRATKVSDSKIFLYMEMLKIKNPREWYAALMDYGSYLKQNYPNPSRRSKHHTKQKAFKGSVREVRGAVLKAMLAGAPLKTLPFEKGRVRDAVRALKEEGLI